MIKWSEQKSSFEECRYDHILADTPLGLFRIEWKSWKNFPSPVLYLNDEYISVHHTLDEAKKAAEQYLVDVHLLLSRYLKEPIE